MCVPERSPREMKGADLRLQRPQRRRDILALDAGRIALRSDQDEIVVHHRIALHAQAFGEKLLLGGPGVDQHDIGVAAPRGVERLAGALRQHLHADAELLLDDRQQIAEQAGILRRCRRGDDDRLVLCCYAAGRPATRPRPGQQKPASSSATNLCGRSPSARFQQPLRARQRMVKVRPTRSVDVLTIIERTIRMIPRASAKLRSPLLVSSAIAVVIVRV